MVVVCARGGNFFPRAEKKTSADERKVARRRRRQKRDVRFLEEFAERKRVVANERRWFGRVAVARSSAPARRRRSWINSSFFFKRESAFEEWLTPQKRELFFEDFFPLFLFLAKRVVASTIERKARESSEGGFRMNDVVRIVSRVLDDDDDDDGALVHEMDNG